ncbi:MAG TPA: hypothetical protein VLQ93_15390 [Myxococcaceae bacterium]|nr:hypothetical protein [Myxococcaceae bacterium]
MVYLRFVVGRSDAFLMSLAWNGLDAAVLAVVLAFVSAGVVVLDDFLVLPSEACPFPSDSVAFEWARYLDFTGLMDERGWPWPLGAEIDLAIRDSRYKYGKSQ